MEGLHGQGAWLSPAFALEVQRQSLFQMPLRPHAVDPLLRFAEPAVGVVFQHTKGQAAMAAIIDDRQDAERPVVDFVDSPVAREVSQSLVEVIGREGRVDFSPPRPRPSFG